MTCCKMLEKSWCARYFEGDGWYVCDDGGYTADKMLFCFYCGTKLEKEKVK